MTLKNRVLATPGGARRLRLARERYRWQVIHWDWPRVSLVKAEYARRRRGRRRA